MKTSRRLLAGLAGTALAGTALTCSLGGAASAAPVPWQLGFVADTMVQSSDGSHVYAVGLDDSSGDDIADVAVVNTSDGAVTEQSVQAADLVRDGAGADAIDSVTVTPGGMVFVGATWPGTADSPTYGVDVLAAVNAQPDTECGTAMTTPFEPYLLAAYGCSVVASDGSQLSVNGSAIDMPVMNAGDYAGVQQVAIRNNTFVALGSEETAFDDPDTPADESTWAPTAWVGSLTGTPLTRTALSADPTNLALAQDGTVYVGEYVLDGTDVSSYQVEVVGGDDDGDVFPVDDTTHLAVTGDGTGLYAGDQIVDLSDTSHVTDVNWPVYDNLIAAGVMAPISPETVYSAHENDEGTGETIVKLTPPAISDLAIDTDGDGSAALTFTGAAQAYDDPALVTYTVTAQALDADGQPVGDPVPSDDVWNDQDGSSWEADFSGDTALVPGTTYRFDVRADNGAFVVHTALTQLVRSVVPHPATITVSGTPTVGQTLGVDLHGAAFDDATVSYSWEGYGDGGRVLGAEGPTLALTSQWQGLHVVLDVHAEPKDADQYAAYDDSFDGGVVAAAPVEKPVGNAPVNNAPVTNPAPKPVQVGSVSATPVKAGAKKLTLSLPGVTTVPGKVKVYAGKKLLGSATVTDGKLVLKLHTKLHKGKQHLKVSYAGSAQVAGFTQHVTLKVK